MRVPIFSREPTASIICWRISFSQLFAPTDIHTHTHTLIHTYIFTYYTCKLSYYSKRWRLSRPGKPTHQEKHQLTHTHTNTCIKHEYLHECSIEFVAVGCFVAFVAFVNERSTHSVGSLTRSFTTFFLYIHIHMCILLHTFTKTISKRKQEQE